MSGGFSLQGLIGRRCDWQEKIEIDPILVFHALIVGWDVSDGTRMVVLETGFGGLLLAPIDEITLHERDEAP